MSGPTGLNSFRPITSLGLLIDYLFWHTNAYGYHLTNVALFAGCCVSIVILVSQLLSGEKYLRFVASGLAGILFAVYPIHPESVAWIIGRVDTQCTLFFLLSLICYFQFRKAGNALIFLLSFLFFFISLTTKEMAVVLPAVVLVAELLLAKDLEWQEKGIVARLKYPAFYFLFLAIFAVVRTLAIGTLVGGYGSTDLKTTLLSLKNFLDWATLKKIVYGVNEELPLKSNYIQYVYISLALAVSPAVLSFYSKRNLRLIAFLLAWMLVSVLPTFQIWHIYPNLVGSRLFFLGSVPLVILIAVCCLTIFPQVPPLWKQPAYGLRAIAIGASLTLAFFWYQACDNNLKVWIRAGEDIRRIEKQVLELCKDLKYNQYIHLVDLPQDDSGAGLIGRPEYLYRMLSPALTGVDVHDKVITTELLLSRDRNYIYPKLIHEVAQNENVIHRLKWNKKDRVYKDWKIPGNNTPDSGALILESEAEKENVAVKEGQTLWFKTNGLNPLSIAWFKLKILTNKDNSVVKARLVYRSKHQPENWIDYSIGPVSGLNKDGELLFIPFRHRNWVLHGAIDEVGIEFLRASKNIEVESRLSFGYHHSIFPTISLADSSPIEKLAANKIVLLPCESISPLYISFDVTGIENATGARVMIGKPGVPITVRVQNEFPHDALLLFKKDIHELSAKIEIPDKVIVDSIGKHQVCAVAIDKNGKPVGYLSEPRFFEICKNRPPVIK